MKKVISLFAVLMMIGVLCVGCNKTETSKPDEAAPKVEKDNAQNWEPETKKEPAPAATGVRFCDTGGVWLGCRRLPSSGPREYNAPGSGKPRKLAVLLVPLNCS